MVRGAIDGELEGDADISSSPSTFRFRPDMALLGTVRTPCQCAFGVLRLLGHTHMTAEVSDGCCWREDGEGRQRAG